MITVRFNVAGSFETLFEEGELMDLPTDLVNMLLKKGVNLTLMSNQVINFNPVKETKAFCGGMGGDIGNIR